MTRYTTAAHSARYLFGQARALRAAPGRAADFAMLDCAALGFAAAAAEALDARINERAAGDDMIARYATPGGMLWVYEWGRDCDCCEAGRAFKIKATRAAYEAECERIAAGAEGPWSLTVVPADAVPAPTFRDRVAEAWDDGETYSV